MAKPSLSESSQAKFSPKTTRYPSLSIRVSEADQKTHGVRPYVVPFGGGRVLASRKLIQPRRKLFEIPSARESSCFVPSWLLVARELQHCLAIHCRD